jgi:hypothetical protein
VSPDGWEDLNECPECCGPVYPYAPYPYYPYGYGPPLDDSIFADCCPSPIKKKLYATVVGCNGGSYELNYDINASDPPSITVWDSGPGTICDVPDATSLITIRCESSFPNPGGVWFAFMYDAVASGTIVSVSCNPFMMEVIFDLSLTGCTCGPVTVYITE